MKKLAFSLAIVMLAVPAMARVDITATCDANVVTVSYESNEPNHIRAFALDISCTNDANIAVLDWNDTDYYIYPTTIDINSNGTVDDYGTPVSLQSDFASGTPAYNGTLVGPPGSEMTIEMGSLYEGEPNAPADSGTLITFSVDEDCCISITGNVIRGGDVIMEDPCEIVDVNFVGCCATVPGCECLGDICDTATTGPPDGRVDFGDWSKLTTELQTNGDPGDYYNIGLPAGYECIDLCDTSTTGPPDGRVDFGDWSKLTTELQTNGDPGDYYNVGCPF